MRARVACRAAAVAGPLSRACTLALALVLAPFAHATPARDQEACMPLDEAEFRALVLDAQAAIDNDDPTLHASIVGEILERVPCMSFAPAPRMWADYLVGVAIVEFARGGDWQTPMGAALRIRPSVDRGVGGGHPIATWEPPPPTATSPGTAPEGVDLWVDGAQTPDLPPPEGLYLVQKQEDGFWATMLLDDGEVPVSWLSAPIERPPVIETSAWILFGLGGGGFHQWPTWGTDYISQDDWFGALPGLVGRGLLQYGVVGVLGEASTSWAGFARSTAGKLQAGIGLVKGRTILVGGAGLAGTDVFEGAVQFERATSRTIVLPYVMVSGQQRLGERTVWDFGGTVGVGPAVGRFLFYMGAEPPGKGAPWRYGLSADLTVASFEQRRIDPSRIVWHATWRFAVEAGWHFGVRQ